MEDEFYDVQDHTQEQKEQATKDNGQAKPDTVQKQTSDTGRSDDEGVRPKVTGADLDLHRACFDNDIEKIDQILKTWDREKLCNFDDQGNAAIHVAVLKGNVAAVQKLLQYDYPYNIKNEGKWKPLMAAIAQKDETMARAIIRYRIDVLRKLREKQMQGLVKIFLSIQDCQFKIHWDFNSFFLWPLLKRFAPQDTYLVWKEGPHFRIDATMLGMDNKSTNLLPQWKKGHFSMLLDASDQLNPRVVLLDRQKKFYWDVTTEVRAKLEGGAEGGDTEGTFKGKLDDLQVQMMMKNGARKHYLKTENFVFNPLKNWVGEDKIEKIDQWKTLVYQLEGQLVTVRKIKQRVNIPRDATFDDYLEMDLPQDYVREINVDPLKGLPGKGDKFNPQDAEDLGITEDMYKDALEQTEKEAGGSSGFLSPDVHSPRQSETEEDPFQPADAEQPQPHSHSQNNSFSGSFLAPFGLSNKSRSTAANTLSLRKGARGKSTVGDQQPSQPRKITCKCWMTQDFPMKLTQFLPLLQLVSTTNKVIGKAADFIEKYGKRNYFPVKVQVPLVFTIYITLSTLKFELLTPSMAKELGEGFFDVPADYELKEVEQSMAQIVKEMQENADDNVNMRDPKTGDEWFEQDNAGTKFFSALHERRQRKLSQQLKLSQTQQTQDKS